MHTPGRPDVMQELAKYDSILPEIISSLTNSISIAESFGINFENIIVDPGIGFGKTVEQNLEILRNLSELLKLRRPILIGTSRKSFIGKLLGDIDVHSRIEGSSATVAVSILNGASFVRVHDVNEMKKVVRMTDAIQGKKLDKDNQMESLINFRFFWDTLDILLVALIFYYILKLIEGTRAAQILLWSCHSSTALFCF